MVCVGFKRFKVRLCSILRRFAANCGVLRCFEILENCGELQCFAAFCGELPFYGVWRHFAAFCGVLQRFAAFCGVLRHFAAFCGKLRRIAAKPVLENLFSKRSLTLRCFKGEIIVIVVIISYSWQFFQNGKITRYSHVICSFQLHDQIMEG